MLHIIMQMAEMQVPPFFLNRLSRNLIGFENPIYDHLSRSISSSFGVHGIGRGFSCSLLSNFLFFSLVDTVIAYGVDLCSLGLSELGLTN